MKARFAISLVMLLAAGCGFAGTGIGPTDWECQAYDMNGQYFRAWGTDRQQTFESVMAQCRLQSMDGSTCIGDPEKCMPPKPQ
ncbi:MAG: hypothetical protein IT386_00810 [Deltaproteobacteria bacterium]|nr:hypothetical protein [Deltaproteobacteria bacterium]